MIQSLEKAIALLNAVAGADDWVGVRELARITGLKPPTAQQLLKTLQALRYLEFDDNSRRYRIGIGALMLGRGVDSAARVGEFARPFIDKLFSDFGETTVACACERGVYSCVAYRHCAKALATSIPSAHDLEKPHIMACGQVLLAWQGDSAISSYIETHGINGGTKTLIELLKKVREAGCSELIDFNNSAVAAYGVPVFDVSGHVVLALGWSIPLSRFGDEVKAKVLPLLLETAETMSAALNAKAKKV